ncbi:hypothetical protein [Bradyrhizobium sp. UFLA03-84]|uniref:hypothetical protein n=1 Tax=Bradyrhizobium sp. UFLA03-84 TaxID=418599 RepID=UPI001304544B|nr:hypothetical protein [Bradyrhizobium sp. UFLA03-84]
MVVEEFAIVMHRTQARRDHHIQTLPQLTSLLATADELTKRGGRPFPDAAHRDI